MKIFYAAAEAYPLIKIGGLADVAGSLPRALSCAGHDARIAVPAYRGLDRSSLSECRMVARLPIAMPPHERLAEVYAGVLPDGVTAYLVSNEHYFGRDSVYGYPDDDERFVFFTKAVSALLPAIGWRPDILHANDWHTALLPPYARNGPDAAFYGESSTVFTIHNLAYQGPFSERTRRCIALPGWDAPNLMAAGIADADMVNTVSPRYREEILTRDGGAGLHRLLRRREDRLRGILNDLDYQTFDPANDGRLAIRLNGSSTAFKAGNRQRLRAELHLDDTSSAGPVVGLVSRLVDQKGLDLVAPALGSLVDLGAQIAVMGRGERRYEAQLADAAQRYPGRVAYVRTDDEATARRIYAGADCLLAPSRFEPCGLGPLIALRYGAIPIVRSTGGLADTILDYAASHERGLGFVFHALEPQAIVEAFRRALRVFHAPDAWRKLTERAMAADFSWQQPRRAYEEMYQDAAASRLARRELAGVEAV